MSTYPNPWIQQSGEPLESEHITDYVGMVYLIVNKNNNKKYIGKKFFWSTKKLPPLKGKTRKRIKRGESDWKNYWGSSNSLKEDMEKYNHLHFERYVLELCYTKTQCSYYEMKHQMENEVLLREDFYNDFMGGKINGKHLERL